MGAYDDARRCEEFMQFHATVDAMFEAEDTVSAGERERAIALEERAAMSSSSGPWYVRPPRTSLIVHPARDVIGEEVVSQQAASVLVGFAEGSSDLLHRLGEFAGGVEPDLTHPDLSEELKLLLQRLQD